MAVKEAKPITEQIYTRAPYWQDVSDEKWMDWRWQMSHRLNTVEELSKVINLTGSERKALSADGLFRVDITPYFASLIDPDDPACPIRLQSIPQGAELEVSPGEMADPCGEDAHSPVPGLVHRYPDRVLFLVNEMCSMYCRYCTRSRMVGDGNRTLDTKTYDKAFEIGRAHV